MNQLAAMPRRTAAGIPTPRPIFASVLSPLADSVGTTVEEDVGANPAAEAVLLVDASTAELELVAGEETMVREMEFVEVGELELAEVMVEVPVLDCGLATSLAVILKNWLFASDEVLPSKKMLRKKVFDTPRSLFVSTFQVKDVTLEATFSVRISQHQAKEYEHDIEKTHGSNIQMAAKKSSHFVGTESGTCDFPLVLASIE